MHIYNKKQLIFIVSTSALILVVLMTCLKVTAFSLSIGEEFSRQDIFVDGVLVGIDSEDTTSMIASNLNNDQYVVGVTQQSGSNLVTITKDYSNKPVAISGEVSVLASDINGSISKGDLLSASWVDGLVMKVQDGSGARIVGVALEDFNNSNSNSYSNIETSKGNVPNVKVNYLKIRLSDGNVYANPSSTMSYGGITDKLAGKDVSIFRSVAGLFVFIVSIVLAGLFVYSSIKGSFIAFGRNPLASNSIYSGLIQISTISVALLGIGAGLMFLLWVF